jgi:general secretion pathway protein G
MKRMTIRQIPRNRGFTLIELLVVMVILAVLAALIVPRLISRTDTAKVDAAKSDEATLASELQTFHLDCDRYPTTDEGLNALESPPSDVATKWKGPYSSDKIPNDPWGNPYVYQAPGVNGGSFSITSYGSDGQPGGTDTAADIIDTVQ